jgi:phosphate transport system substrate-binding protein
VIPNQASIEGKSGVKLSVLINGSGNGLLDLAAGKADMAMIAAPLDVEAKIINAKTPGAIDAAALSAKQVGSAKINLIVHPSNTVKLTPAQAKDVLGGKIANWKDVGGPDSPILVVFEAPGQGTRANVESAFLQGAPSDKARIVPTLANVADVVRQSPGAIGYGNSSSITPAVQVVPGIEIAQPLSLVTKGAPDATAAKVIAAVSGHAK